MADSITIENKENDLVFELDNLVISGTVPLDDYYTKEQTDSMFDNYYDKQEVDDKIANIEVTAGNYTGGTGINVSDENVISVDTETVALKSDIPDTSEFVTETGLSGRVIPEGSNSEFLYNGRVLELAQGSSKATMDGNGTLTISSSTGQNMIRTHLADNLIMFQHGVTGAERINLDYISNQNKLKYTNSVSNITYDFDDVATQDYVDSAIANISQFQIVKVDVLPETGESNKLYLVPSTTTETDNIYNEYLWVEVSTDTFDWELIGTTQIDLSNYYTKTELDGKVIPQDSNSNWSADGNTLTLGDNGAFDNQVFLNNEYIRLRGSYVRFATREYNQGVLSGNQYGDTEQTGAHFGVAYISDNGIKYNFNHITAQLKGDTLETKLTQPLQLNIGKIYLCNETSTSGTYLQGHLYLIGGTSGAYTATDITPKISTVESQSSTMSDLYDNCTTLIGQGKKIKYFTLTPTQDFTVSCSSINIATTGNITNTERNFTILGTDNTYTFYLNAINTEYGTMSFACNYYSVSEGWNMQIYTDTMSGDTEWHGNIVNFSNGTNIAGFDAEIVPTNYPITIYYE